MDNVPVVAGEDTPLNDGATLRFGGASNSWVFHSGPPSELVVQELGDGATTATDHTPSDGLIALPSAADPRALVFRRSNSWLLEVLGNESRPITDALTFELDGRAYQARLGHDGPTVTNSEDRPSVASADLVLHVSRDEEHVGVEILVGGRTLSLSPRNHLYLLVVLGRARAGDRANGMGLDEEGWCYVDAVQRELALKSPEALNVYVFRLRQDFARLGFCDAGQVIERRRASGQLRIGLPCERIRIERTT